MRLKHVITDQEIQSFDNISELMTNRKFKIVIDFINNKKSLTCDWQDFFNMNILFEIHLIKILSWF